MSTKTIFLYSIILTTITNTALACDLCPIYSSKEATEKELSISLAEQFTSFHRIQEEGNYKSNSEHQSFASSITQVVGRYNLSKDSGIQIALPIINRQFKRVENNSMESGTVSGIGDASLLALYTPYRKESENHILNINLKAGIKLPTGSTNRLAEESSDSHQHEEEPESHQHEEESNVIHGHDLTLGSGSVDYIVGASSYFEKNKFFTDADLQYSIRTEGDYDYRFQNDLICSLGLGAYALLTHEQSLSIKANLSGEHKGNDTENGNTALGTGITSLFLGPEIKLTRSDYLAVSFAIDLPLFIDNTGTQIVPDFRVRAGATYKF
jgi:hypothetical protein